MKLRTYLLVVAAVVGVALAVPAEECNPVACTGACRCWSASPPYDGLFEASQTPQIVFLTFDESISVSTYPYFQQLLAGRQNPNGCPIGMTFYVNHDYTDYSLVNDLYKAGNEIGVHSVSSGSALVDYWLSADEAVWSAEVGDLKTILEQYANVPKSVVRGGRAPYVEPGGDDMIRALAANNVNYDFSYFTRQFADPPLWPYTLDYATGQDCLKPRCPTESHPGFWSVPLVPLFINDTLFCALADQCGALPTRQEQFDFFMSNFRRSYDNNRAPFSINARGSYFIGAPQVLEGYFDFLDEILSYGDVFVVTVQQGIEWIKNPTSVADILNFQAWQCPAIVSSCSGNLCVFDNVPPGGARYLTNCADSCPPCYPWLNDPVGEACVQN